VEFKVLEGTLANILEKVMDEKNHGKVRDAVVRLITTRVNNMAAAFFFWYTVAIANEVQV
jgi:hypothetical protein